VVVREAVANDRSLRRDYRRLVPHLIRLKSSTAAQRLIGTTEILGQNPISLTDFDVLRSWLDRGKSGLA
jgi:hypothetical protein